MIFWLVWEAAFDAKFGLLNLCFVGKDTPWIGEKPYKFEILIQINAF